MPGRDDRRNDRGRSNNRDPDYRGRRDSEYRHGDDRQHDSYPRERSRDARDPYRNHNDRSDYEHRQQSHYGHQQPVPPPPPPRSPYGQQQQGMFQQQPPHHNFVPNQGYQRGIPGSSIVQNRMQPQPLLRQFQQPPIVGHPPQAFQGNAQMSGMLPGAPVPNGIHQNTGFVPRPVFPGVPNPGRPGVLNPNVQSWQPQPQRATHPDIIGIAAKAAQALAASQTILQQPGNGFQLNQPAPVQHFPGQPPHPFNPGFQPQQPPPQDYPQQRRGRTTARMHELPIAVQFSVQVRSSRSNRFVSALFSHSFFLSLRISKPLATLVDLLTKESWGW